MPARSLRRAVALAVLAAVALLAACGAPFERSKNRMEQLQFARKEGRGARIVLRFPRETPVREVAGELIASGPDTVFVLAENGLSAVSASELQAAEIAVHERAARGDPAGAVDPPVLEIRHQEAGRWKLLVRHARFPQGLPPGFERQAGPGP